METMEIYESRLVKTLNDRFGFASFRPNQKEAIQAILQGRDLFAVMPTSAGKSLCYQLPALLLEGVTIVVSPLIALMADQVASARKKGIPADFLSTETSANAEERRRIFRDLHEEKTKLLYLSPERLSTPGFLEFLSQFKVAFFALDEAHCITEWGNTFRVDYLALSKIRKYFPNTPIGAWTATVTQEQQSEIIQMLHLKHPLQIRASFDRPELQYIVRPKTHLNEQILSEIQKHPTEVGIVYRFSRDETDKTARFLQSHGINALPYHAGLSDSIRNKNQKAFMEGKVNIIVATIAFGMGIDKEDIRYIIHGDMPKSLESYYQETGRAGRDGKAARCILFYANNDYTKLLHLIKNADIDDSTTREAIHRLDAVKAFASQPGCRRQRLLAYFGEKHSGHCGNCDYCQGEVQTMDVGKEARLVIQIISSLKGSRGICYGENYLIDFIRGEATEKIVMRKHDRNPLFGRGAYYSRNFWSSLFAVLLTDELLFKSNDRYGIIDVTNDGECFFAKRDYSNLVFMVASDEMTKKMHSQSTTSTEPKDFSPKVRLIKKN